MTVSLARALAAACIVSVAASAPAQAPGVQQLGVFGGWAAFARPAGCWAIALPSQGPRHEGWRPFAAVNHVPAARVRGQVHIRLSRAKRPDSAILLRIDGRTFQLVGGGREAWAPDAAADAAIVSAMRTAVSMSVQTRSVRGGIVRDTYALRGAATAIDAAAIACASRRIG